jgi:hypothetical protein
MSTHFRKLVLCALIFLGAVSLAVAAQCLGTTRAGKPCKNQGAGSSSYCRYHDPAVKHCSATTNNGTQCRNLPQSGSTLCGVHKK